MFGTSFAPGYSDLKKWAVLAASVLVLVAPAGCSRDSAGKETMMVAQKVAMPITASTAVRKDMPVQIRVIGTVQPLSTVAIKSQVQGELIGVHFKDGQEVKKGDLLFTIDPRPFEASLKQARALLEKDRAQLENARTQVKRYGSVVDKGYVARDQFDTVRSNAAALEATVKADEAAVDNARLSLQYCTIHSPINGVTGNVRVTVGNIIKANDGDNPLVTIKEIRPLYVTFSVPERNLPEIMKYMADRKLEVLAGFAGDEAHPVRGWLSFIDNAINSTAGTIQVWATFPNGDKKLWPGQFVNVVLTLITEKGKTVIPSQAIQMGQNGSYVYVIKPDMSVEYRTVVTGSRMDNEIVVEKGVSPGEKVVTDGQLRLATGSLVKIVDSVDKKDGGANL